ncbi:CMRF35-like molecule 1 isoform X1 [Sus scrofa]|uniref:CD300 molecule like family member f n=1 Tax=Sus scrofa TaxID=9823 RepID=A0A4X1SI79_PIG|nr:CMRF35-like molecule 1 isoform X1 [Sus scrofa]XP_020922334.1 CMRF35-like molecule 1 isoform X1 [Sus scrofa]
MYLLMLLPLLFQLSGSSPVTGPKALRGQERGSLTVQCRYTPGWESHGKWWCRGADWSSCKILVQTTASEPEVKRDRVSIRDDRENRTITVTTEQLRLDDAGIYWCGIARVGTDHGAQVRVTVDPAPTTVPTTTSAINTFTAPVTSGDDSLNMTSHGPNGSSIFGNLSTLLPLIFAVLLLLLVVASVVVWRMVKQQKKGAATSPEQPLESDLCYANLNLQEPNSGSSQRKASTQPSSSAQGRPKDVEYVTMAPFPREDIAYAALSLGDNENQEATYSNMGDLLAHDPSRSHEEPTEYSAVKKA